MAVVNGTQSVKQVCSDHGVTTYRVKQIVSALPKDIDSSNAGAVERTVNEVCGLNLQLKQQYTETEMKAAVRHISMKTMSYSAAQTAYGIPERTLREKRELLMTELAVTSAAELKRKYETDPAEVETKIQKTAFMGVYKESYLTSSESCILGALAHQLRAIGQGWQPSVYREHVAAAIHAKGADIVKATRQPVIASVVNNCCHYLTGRDGSERPENAQIWSNAGAGAMLPTFSNKLHEGHQPHR